MNRVENILDQIVEIIPPVIGAGWIRKPDVEDFKIYELRVPKNFDTTKDTCDCSSPLEASQCAFKDSDFHKGAKG